jgi:hypothetical protein
MQKRAMRFNSKVMADLVEAELGGEDEEKIGKLEKKLVLWTRYKTTAENSFQRALRAVEQFLARRRRESMQQQKIVLQINNLAENIVSKRFREGRLVTPDTGTDTPVKPPDAGGGGL